MNCQFCQRFLPLLLCAIHSHVCTYVSLYVHMYVYVWCYRKRYWLLYIIINITSCNIIHCEEYNVTFLARFTTIPFDIMIISDDDLTNEYELVNVSISSISNGHTIGDPGVATVSIIRTTGEYCANLFMLCTYVCRYIILHT